MTIKEIEALSGMSRANIRYYEAEGFLSPERRENGYRDYSEEDLETLKRVKLLRLLGVSLADIKAAKDGSLPLEELMARRLSGIAQERTALSQSEAVCRELREAQVRYEDLDAQRYLDELSRRPGGALDLPREDAEPKVTSPIRRFLVRGIDFMAYSLLWMILLTVVFRQNIALRDGWYDIVDSLAVLGLLFLLEPLQLRFFGTTLGKWILGLSVTNGEEGRLRYLDALIRTWNVFLYGYGLNLPGINLYRLWKSYKACDRVETLPWEADSVLRLREGKVLLRVGSFAAACFVLVGGLVLSVYEVQMPVHRGEITVAEFCENYNRLVDYYDPDVVDFLNSDGTWAELPSERQYQNGTVYYLGDRYLPELHFTEDGNGRMTGLTISYRLEEVSFIASPSNNVRILATLAFVRAQPGVGVFDTGDADRVLNAISQYSLEDFQDRAYGVEVSNQVRSVGYENCGNLYLMPIEGASEHRFAMDYTMTLADAG